MKKQQFKVVKGQQDLRLDQFIKSYISDHEISTKKIKHWIISGSCHVNGKLECRPNYRCRLKDKVEFTFGEVQKENDTQTIAIIWEDDNIRIFDKPHGISVDEIENHQDIFLAHRLDKATSGLLVTATNEAVSQTLQALFKHRKISKTYHAIIQGTMKKPQGRIHTSHGNKGKKRGLKIWGSVMTGGQEAITDYEIQHNDNNVSFIRFSPQTGRTHQLRVHCSEGGRPILGDLLYGDKLKSSLNVGRLMLHASHLKFMHPLTQELIEVKSPLPEDFSSFYKKRRLLKEIKLLYSSAP